jgi:predicted NAD/FAD-dependent oxidoreductase
MMAASASRVAVIGAGIAGASCARWLHDAGYAVQVFDKSRGVGGRLSTRRIDWTDAAGVSHQASFDHGAPGFQVRAPAFAAFVARAHADGLLLPWRPRDASGARAPEADTVWVPTPDMPALCRALLKDLPVHTQVQVDALHRDDAGWRLDSGGATVARDFGAVVLTIPPAQAAALLQPLRPGWAQQALTLPMLPDWTLMGLASAAGDISDWQLARPSDGALASVLRNHSKPGRAPLAGMAHWVAHATADWSARHLETPAAVVQDALQQALARWFGRAPDWRYVTVHRWRYAVAPAGTPSGTGDCWWDAETGLGVCGDAWGGGGVEAAWGSARALAAAISGINPA